MLSLGCMTTALSSLSVTCAVGLVDGRLLLLSFAALQVFASHWT